LIWSKYAWHRFSDFTKLCNHLNKSYDSVIINALPDASILKNDNEIINFRKKYLADWLNKILNHTILLKDRFVSIFVDQDGSSDVFRNYNTNKQSLTAKTIRKGSELVSSAYDL